MLVAFGGLPGTGKTTIARAVAERCRATYVRIDAIEQAIRSADVLRGEVGAAGYVAAYAVAAANLNLGLPVVADSVNPIFITRRAWREVARDAGAAILEVEVTCTDPVEHRRRVETRTVDVPDLILPTWAEVTGRDYEAWTTPRCRIDTAHVSAADAVDLVCREIAALSRAEKDEAHV